MWKLVEMEEVKKKSREEGRKERTEVMLMSALPIFLVALKHLFHV